MIKRRFIIALIIFFVFVTNPFALKAEQPDSYLDFARSLFRSEDFYRAITEAKRFLFLNPDDPRRVEAYLLIARSYLKIGRYAQAKTSFVKVATQKDRPGLAAEAIWELGRCLELLGPRSEALNYYRQLIEKPPLTPAEAADIQNKARYRLGWLLLEDGQWHESKEVLSSVAADHPLGDSAARLSEQVREGQTLPYVSPVAAGILSAVVPGAGQIYVHRPVDAALAFGLNAAFLWGTIEACQKESWAVFTLLGVIELSLYGGNIYNAINGGHIHNRKLKKDFIKRLHREHALRLGYSPVFKGVFLSWTIIH